MVLGKNKGHRYEDRVFELLEELGFLYPNTAHNGMGGGVDAIFCHLGKPYDLEVKNGLQADYGQKKFNWTKKDGWEWSEEDETTELYTALGALGRVRSKEIIPLRYTKEKGKITYADAAADQKAFEDRKFVIEPQALWRYYGEKGIHYIQVGEGFGFYHLDEDTARLGTPQFVCQFILRFRAKYHDRYKRTRDESGKVLSKKKTPWNYSFFAVLKVRKKPQKSKYNLEPSEEQNLPPIKPNP